MEIVVIIVIILNLLWLVAIINALRLLYRLRCYRGHLPTIGDNQESLKSIMFSPNTNCLAANYNSNNDEPIKLKHLCGICFYKEPMDLISQTVDSLAAVPNANKKLSVYLGMEAGTPDKEEKQRQLIDTYRDKFEHLIVTIHPRGLPGDIAGKCSNLNYASRKAVKYLENIPEYGLTSGKSIVLVTTGDSDTVFPPQYFAALEADYYMIPVGERDYTIWQSPLFYCMNLSNSPFFVRVTGLMRTFFMMGYLIPWNINTMSIFSLSLNLYKAGQYTHPGYQMEDIIALIRWMLAVRRECRVRALPVATLSGPTSGTSYLNELYEWARQIRRWTIGAAEVFHYFAIKARRLPPFVSFTWATKFMFYYGILLCIAPIYGVIAPFIVSSLLRDQRLPTRGLVIPNQNTFTWIMLGFLGLQYFWFACVFAINKLAEPIFPRGARDETPFYVSIVHWVLSFPTMIGYCLVELAAFAEVTVRGKDVCSHSMSKKDGLVSVATTATIASVNEYV